jgi:hypothetical protein
MEWRREDGREARRGTIFIAEQRKLFTKAGRCNKAAAGAMKVPVPWPSQP